MLKRPSEEQHKSTFMQGSNKEQYSPFLARCAVNPASANRMFPFPAELWQFLQS